MEFTASVQGLAYHFLLLKKNTFLVSHNNVEYILYKADVWKCADERANDLTEDLGAAIDDHLKRSRSGVI
jgi:hypothetical protein